MADDERITPRDEDYSAWYLDVIRHGDLLDEAPVRGCKVLKPHGFAIWEHIKAAFDQRFKATGHKNAYFPLFIPMEFLSREADHVEGFAKECAVVTHHRLRGAEGGGVELDPNSELEEPLVVRPTSETIIWHMYGRWIDSWRDLPVLINQWANVVRWEMKTRPFLRTTEFLWQEGHTAHATEAEALDETLQMLGVYAEVAEDVLAVPVLKGRKSARERFAGAVDTYTIEAMMQNGWALQAGTSHFLGQNFAKAFDVTFQDEEGERDYVWATSWGVSTRLVGAVIMTHSDDDGLVLPPKLAPVQVVIVPVYRDDTRDEVLAAARDLQAKLAPHFRVELDDRETMRPGAKYFEWERKGVPLRLELGPRDLKKGQAYANKRTDREKFGIPLDGIVEQVGEVLEAFQAELLERARAFRDERTWTHETFEGDDFEARLRAFGELLEGQLGFYKMPWGGSADDEDRVKDATKATIRCFLDERAEGRTCALTGKPAREWAVFARSY